MNSGRKENIQLASRAIANVYQHKYNNPMMVAVKIWIAHVADLELDSGASRYQAFS